MASFAELVLVLGVVALGGLVASRVGIPLLTVYLGAGILLGPTGLHWVSGHEGVSSLGSLGVSLFLFSIALKLDWRLFLDLGWRAPAAGAAQISFAALVAAGLGWMFGFHGLPLALFTIAAANSSTVIVVKLLADKRELDSLHGQLALAILILQDLLVVFALVLVGAVAAHEGVAASRLATLLAGAAVLMVGYVLGGKFVLHLLATTLRQQELQLIVVLALAAGSAALASALGFSREIGAFVAGLAVAASPYKEGIHARLQPVRDFVMLFFFLDLGLRVDLPRIQGVAVQVAVLAAFALVAKPLLLLPVLTVLGYPARTAFQTSLALGQMSEFSLLLAAAARAAGIVDERFLSLVVGATLLSFLVSPLVLDNADRLYARWGGRLARRWRGHPAILEPVRTSPFEGPDTIVVGAGSYGLRLARHLQSRGRRVLVVDFDPEALRRAARVAIPALYGDVEDEQLYDRLPLDRCRWIVFTVPTAHLAQTLVRSLRQRDWRGHLAMVAKDDAQAHFLEQLGAHVVLSPLEDSAELAAEAITDADDIRLWLPDWPVGFRQIRLRSDCAHAGHTIAQLSLRTKTGATIIAMSRAGRVYFDPSPDTPLFPNDRLLLMGREHELARAEEYFEARRAEVESSDDHFSLARFLMSSRAEPSGRTLAESAFRTRYGVTIVGIERGHERIVLPRADETLRPQDILVVIGPTENIDALAHCEGFERLD